MKVGLITPSISRIAGGISEVVRNYAHALNEIADINLSVFGLRDEFSNDVIHQWEPLNLQLFPVLGTKSFGYAPGIVDSMVRSNVGICHLHVLWMYTSIATTRWHLQKKRPYVVTTHGFLEEWALNNSKFKKQVAALLYERKCLTNAACLHAITEAEYSSIRNYNLKNPVCIIPSAIHLPTTDYSDTEAPWKDFIRPGEKVLFYIGRKHPKKGLVNLLHAWKKTKQDPLSSAWKLVIAGWDQNNHEATLRQVVRENELAKDVFFMGPQFNEAKEKCFYHADALVLPSFSEGLPVTVLEAWSFHLPVLMTPECHIPEGFHAGAAIRIDPTVQSIASGLHRLFEMSPDQLAQMGQKGRRLVEKKFTQQQAACQMHALYRWLLGEGDCPDNVILK